MKAFIATYKDAEWVSLVHGETIGEAKTRFNRTNPEGYGRQEFVDMRLTRLPGQDDLPFTFENAEKAGFTYVYEGEYDSEGDQLLHPEWFSFDCDCEICKGSKK